MLIHKLVANRIQVPSTTYLRTSSQFLFYQSVDNCNKLSTLTVTSTTVNCSNQGLPRNGRTNRTSTSSHTGLNTRKGNQY